MTRGFESVIVFGGARAGRTLRALRRCGAEPIDGTALGARELAGTIDRDRSVWLVRAGAWPSMEMPSAPPPSRTGLPLCAVGAILPHWADAEIGAGAEAWAEVLARTGGDMTDEGARGERVPDPASVYLEARLARALAGRLRAGVSIEDAIQAVISEAGRVVRCAALDVHDDASLRVAQVVTSLQQGGAERVVVDLAHALPARGVRSCIVTLGAPTRPAFDPPCPLLDLSRVGLTGRAERLDHLARSVIAWGGDLVHAHLLEGDELARIASAGLPLISTLHNARRGWPRGTEQVRPPSVGLLVACSRAVEAEARAGLPGAPPMRTVWNGIDPGRFERAPALLAAARAWRDALGIGTGDLLLLAVANPRPQKRLELLPAVLAATQRELARRGVRRDVHLVVAGSASPESPSAIEALAALRAAVETQDVGTRVHEVGAVAEVAPLIVASDVLVSTSAYEGLSLVHLEALAAGTAVVAADAGGVREVALRAPGCTVVPQGTPASGFAEAIVEAAGSRAAIATEAVSAQFGRAAMAEGYARLYPRAVQAARVKRARSGLVLITNNFSTGGAQSSARRLLVGLAGRGIAVRAVVVEEHVDHPTPGRKALEAAGIEVVAVPPIGAVDAGVAVQRILDDLDRTPPDAVLFWNLVAEHKLLLADALLDVPLYDVSPGEMYFASLQRWFERPRPGLAYASPVDYGARLAGVIVKYQAEAERATALGARVHVIPNGVPVMRRQSRATGSRLVLGTLARIAPHKKIEDLIEALRIAAPDLPSHVLRIAGGVERGADGYAGELRLRAAGLAVEWVGELDDATPFLDELDAFALVAEPAGCPNATLEAMAAGLPVVATDVGGISEQVVDGDTGLLVPRGDVRALAGALARVARDADLRAELARRGREHVEARFGLGRMVEAYRSVCLGGAPPPQRQQALPSLHPASAKIDTRIAPRTRRFVIPAS